MKRALCWIAKIIGAGFIALAVLSLFCLVYSYSGIHIDNPTGATDYKWQPNELKSNMTEGFSWNVMDMYGFNNAWLQSEHTPDVLLMGSSHMEAVNVADDESVAYRLNALLTDKDYYCYNIGTSGHTLCRCINNLAAATKEYTPTKWVIIETSSIEPEQAEMEQVISGSFPKIASYDSGFIYYLQKIPAIKVIYKKLISLISVTSNEDEESMLPGTAKSIRTLIVKGM